MYSLYDTWGFPCVFPHSEISGSLAMCAYPKLIAAYHVLHRLLMPRHSPCALCSLTYSSFVIKTLYNHHKEYLFLACCISYTLIYMQFSKNIFIFVSSPLSDKYYYINIIHICQHFYSFFSLLISNLLKPLIYLGSYCIYAP